MDVGDAPGWRSFFTRNGWRWLGRSDPVHFDFIAGDSSQKSKAVEAFQRLYNRNNPQRRLAVNGVYDAATERALLSSPANGFPFGTLDGDAASALVTPILPRRPLQEVMATDNTRVAVPRVDVAPRLVGNAVVTPLSLVEPNNPRFGPSNPNYHACDVKYRQCQAWLCRKAIVDTTKRGARC